MAKDALELASKHDFKVITTVDLYHSMTKLLENKLEKEDFLSTYLG